MAVFDDFGGTFKGLLGQVDERGIPDLLEPVLNKSSIGGLQGLVNRLETQGFADRVQGWANHGRSSPISALEIGSALKAEEVGQIARAVGLPAESTLTLLADNLPAAVDAATQSGNVVVHGVRNVAKAI
ncbi:YidB family protein [Bradyrhizobium sp. USDA 3364]